MTPVKGKPSSKGRSNATGLSGFSVMPKEIKWGIALVLILTGITYFPVFGHELTNWDDPIYVTSNTLLSSGKFADFWTTPVASNYHPLTMLSLALDYHLGDNSPKVYFFTNLILHLANTVLLAWIILQLMPGKAIWALLVAGLFALHPLHVESVAWVSERKDVLYVFFFFLAWIFWMKWEQIKTPQWLLFSLLFFIASCLSKGMAVVFPGVILIAAWMREIKLDQKFWMAILPAWIIAIVFGIVAIRTQTEAGALSIDNVQLDFSDRVITALHGYVFYLQKFILPQDLSAYYPYPVNFNVNWPIAFVIAPFILIGLGVLIWVKFRSNRFIIAGFLWYLGILLPVSQIISVGNAMAADRYFYLSSIGPLFVLGYYAQQFFDRPATRNFVLGTLIILFVVQAFISRQRVKVWENSIVLFSDVIEKDPASAVAYHGLGEAYNAKGRYADALQQFELALKYRPGYPDVLYNIAVVYDKLNKPAQAIPYYHDALKNKPGYVEALYNLANSYYMARQYDSSVYWFEKTLARKPDHVGALNNMANIYFDLQDFDKALTILKRTLEINPNQEEALYNIGSIYLQRGEFAEAAVQFEKCIQLNKALPDNYRMAGLAYANGGQGEKAMPYMQKAASLGDAMAQQWLQGKGK